MFKQKAKSVIRFIQFIFRFFCFCRHDIVRICRPTCAEEGPADSQIKGQHGDEHAKCDAFPGTTLP